MKKNLYLIAGLEAGPEMAVCKQLAENMWSFNKFDYFGSCVIPNQYSPEQSLAKVLEILKAPAGENFENFLIFYSGKNLSLFKDKLPYHKLDITLFMSKLVEVAAGYETPQQKEIVDCLFFGGLFNLITNLK